MAIEDQLERLERITQEIPQIPPCRCCGKALSILDGITEAVREGVGIHTRCIPKHWSKHSKRINTARCKEFQVEKLFTIDNQGEHMENESLAVILEANKDGFSQDEIDRLKALAVGETFAIGIHAGYALFTRTR